jgi:hypothetical protein
MRDKWFIITAGLGDKEYEDAAHRVSNQSRSLFQWEKQIVLTSGNLSELCPTIFSNHRAILNSSIKGYGYMAWKAEIVFRALNNEYGECDGVVWVDAGCEANSNTFSRYSLKRKIKNCKKYGAAVFTLDTPEREYTKQDAFLEFPEINPNDTTGQIQTTNFFLYGNHGRAIAKRWFEVVKDSQLMIDESISKNGEIQDFKIHRHDQSIFSLSCKSHKTFHVFGTLTTGIGSWKSRARGFFSPFWASRNRTGKTLVPRWFSF